VLAALVSLVYVLHIAVCAHAGRSHFYCFSKESSKIVRRFNKESSVLNED